jgi:hypothetical protein
MRRQILPVILAFVLGFGLGYVFCDQLTSSTSQADSDPSTSLKVEDATKFRLVKTDTARRHVRKYKERYRPATGTVRDTVFAVWTPMSDVECHFEKKLKLADLPAQPDWATGIRVYEAINKKGIAVNYLVYTNSSQTPEGIYNDHLDRVYLIVDKKIDLIKAADHDHCPHKGIVNSHMVCNPNCPEETLL